MLFRNLLNDELTLKILIVPRTWLVAIALSPALIVSLTSNGFPNKLAPKITINLPRNPFYCYLTSFIVVLLTSFINKPDSSRELTIFIIPFISWLEIINLFAKSEGRASDPNNFLWIAASDAAAANPNGIKMFLANGLSSFPKAEELFAKALRSLEA